MDKVKVALVKTKDPYEGIRRVIENLSPHGLIFKGSSVLVKPNLCSPFPPEDVPSNTHPEVIGAVIRFLKEEGASRVVIGDEPVWGLRSQFVYEKSGVKEVMEREGGEWICIDEGKRVKKKIPGGRIFDSLSLPKILDEVDLLINLPKLKVSMMSLVTLSIKNLFGLVTFRDRKRFHRAIDLSYGLIDIAKVVKPSLNIIDGIFVMEGMSAHVGTARRLGLLIGSLDMAAADIVGTQVMGIHPMEIITTQLALKDRLGIGSPDQIEIVGEKIEDVCVSVSRPYSRLVHPDPNVEVIPGGICPGCVGRIPKIPPRIEPGKRYGIIMGKRVKFPRNRDFDELWCFGDCAVEEANRIAHRFPDLKEKLIKVRGCPPLDWWAKQNLEVELKERGWWSKDVMRKQKGEENS